MPEDSSPQRDHDAAIEADAAPVADSSPDVDSENAAETDALSRTSGPRRWPYVVVGLILLGIGLLKGCGGDRLPDPIWTISQSAIDEGLPGDWLADSSAFLVIAPADSTDCLPTDRPGNQLLVVDSSDGQVRQRVDLPLVRDPKGRSTNWGIHSLLDGRIAVSLDDELVIIDPANPKTAHPISLRESADQPLTITTLTTGPRVGESDTPSVTALCDVPHAVDFGPAELSMARSMLQTVIVRVDPDTLQTERIDLGTPENPNESRSYTVLPGGRSVIERRIDRVSGNFSVTAARIDLDAPGVRHPIDNAAFRGAKPFSTDALFGMTGPFDANTEQNVRLRVIPTNGDESSVMSDHVFSDQPTATFSGEPAASANGWYAWEFMDYNGQIIHQWGFHRILVHVEGAPLDDGRIDYFVHEKHRRLFVYGHSFGRVHHAGQNQISPDVRWLLRFVPREKTLEMIDLNAIVRDR